MENVKLALSLSSSDRSLEMETETPANPPLNEKNREINQDLESPTCNTSADIVEDTTHHTGDGFWAWLQVISAFFVFFNTW